MSDVLIRSEQTSDVADIREINIEAFRDHPISRQTEHLIVDALRAADALDLSLVAIGDDRTVGHIAFSKASVGDSDWGWYPGPTESLVNPSPAPGSRSSRASC